MIHLERFLLGKNVVITLSYEILQTDEVLMMKFFLGYICNLMSTCLAWNYYSHDYSSIKAGTCYLYHFTESEVEGAFKGVVGCK